VPTNTINRRSSKPPGSRQKKQYRISNWSQYNAALVQRGSLTVWADEAALAAWHNQQHNGQPGKPRLYSELAITCMATLQMVYHLPLRATQGLLCSVLQLLGVELATPDYSTLCRRRRTLQVSLPIQVKHKPLHLVVDSSGLKVYGEGEWKVRQHGWSKHRTWRKVHLGVDESSGELLAVLVTSPLRHDKDALTDLLEQVDQLDLRLQQVSGDGGYDFMTCHRDIAQRGARAVIPPRRNACPNTRGETPQRDAHLRHIQALAGYSKSHKRQELARQQWKEETGYHRRSLVETAVFRLKHIFGDKLSSRGFDAQANEVLVRCAALNRMTHLGMPQSYAIYAI
jgi:IS5 family transposase